LIEGRSSRCVPLSHCAAAQHVKQNILSYMAVAAVVEKELQQQQQHLYYIMNLHSSITI
jgi:hypothetical protein